MIHHNIEQNTDEWHEVRRGKFTASMFDDLFMKPTTATYEDAIYTVVYQILTGEVEESYSNKDMERGHELEPLAAEAYELLTFSDVKQAGFWEYNEYVGASPDRLVDEDGLLEIKCPKSKTLLKYMESKKLPSIYYWQVHGQMLCTGRKWVDFMAYHPKLEPMIIRVNRDEIVIKELESKLNESIEVVKSKLKLLRHE